MDATLIDKLIDAMQAHTAAVEFNTKAIRYHADVIGYKGDDLNPPAADGKGKAIKLELEQKAPAEDVPLVETTLNQVKAALNTYAKKHGKEKAMTFVAKYAETKKPADIDPAKYAKLIKDAEASQ